MVEASISGQNLLLRYASGALSVLVSDGSSLSSQLALPSSLVSSSASSLYSSSSDALPVLRRTAAAPNESAAVAVEEEMDVDNIYTSSIKGKGKKAGSSIGSALIGLEPVPSSHFIATSSATGHLQIVSLSSQAVVFESQSLAYLPSVISDRPGSAAEPYGPPEESTVQHLLLTDLGQSNPRPHLIVYLENGHLAVYEAVLDYSPSIELDDVRLAVRFVKVLSSHVPTRYGSPSRRLTSWSGLHGLSGRGRSIPAGHRDRPDRLARGLSAHRGGWYHHLRDYYRVLCSDYTTSMVYRDQSEYIGAINLRTMYVPA